MPFVSGRVVEELINNPKLWLEGSNPGTGGTRLKKGKKIINLSHWQK